MHVAQNCAAVLGNDMHQKKLPFGHRTTAIHPKPAGWFDLLGGSNLMLDRIAEFFIFGLVPLVVGALAVPEATNAGEMTIAGEVTYRERIALPPDAVLVVELADVSLADAPATVVARRRIAPTGQVPIRFEIGFDPKAIQNGRTYTLQARITVGERLMFVTGASHQVDPLAGKPQTVLLKMAR